MFNLFGIKIDTCSQKQAREKLAGFFYDEKQHVIVTPNPEILLAAKKDRRLFEALNAADLNMPDGFGLLCALWFYGKHGSRYPGVEMAEDVVRMAAEKNESVFLLGAMPGVGERAAVYLIKKFPSLVIDSHPGVAHKASLQELHAQSAEITERVNRFNPSVLLVAFDHGKQEPFIYEHLSKMPSVKIAIGVGGTFDFWAGTARRAPKLFRMFGFEWLWRLFMEPKRWRRILNATIVFPVVVVWWRLFEK